MKGPDIGRDIDSESNVFLWGRTTSEGVEMIRTKTRMLGAGRPTFTRGTRARCSGLDNWGLGRISTDAWRLRAAKGKY